MVVALGIEVGVLALVLGEKPVGLLFGWCGTVLLVGGGLEELGCSGLLELLEVEVGVEVVVGVVAS